MSDNEQGLLGILIIVIFLVAIGGCTMQTVDKARIKEEAIKNNFARYHPTTGNWEWEITETKE